LLLLLVLLLQVYADASKRRLLQLLDLPQQQLALLTDDPAAALLHVAHMAPPDPARLAAAYVDKPGSRWKRVVAFRPTGAAAGGCRQLRALLGCVSAAS
jgi:hypothetical protein